VKRWIVTLVVLIGCAPDVPSSRERADASDRLEAAALDHQLRAVPGVTGAYAAIHHAFTDPLTGAKSPAAATVLITIAPGADRTAIETAAHQLAPVASIAIVTSPAPATPSRRTPFVIAALVAILAAAGYVAWKTRPTTT
jgi:hypothetical protein